uniref:Uncharacterized protein n=1 Tax=Anopheles farauti TaxID=69004 RepID=A0A182QF46_9DIPT
MEIVQQGLVGLLLPPRQPPFIFHHLTVTVTVTLVVVVVVVSANGTKGTDEATFALARDFHRSGSFSRLSPALRKREENLENLPNLTVFHAKKQDLFCAPRQGARGPEGWKENRTGRKGVFPERVQAARGPISGSTSAAKETSSSTNVPPPEAYYISQMRGGGEENIRNVSNVST